MAITFCGVPLLLEDPGYEVQRWLDRHLPLNDARFWGDKPVALTARIGLGTYNWPTAHPPRINTLYWPTGATRWGHGLFLADDTRLARILAAIAEDEDESRGGVLKFVEESGPFGKAEVTGSAGAEPITIERKMYMLPPRCLTQAGKGSVAKDQLWLLPLVDLRYFWQWRHLGDYELDGDSTWDDLIEVLEGDDTELRGEALGVEIHHSEFEETWLQPDATEWTLPQENAALVLDALAAMTGRRVVFGPQPEISPGEDPMEWVALQTPAEAEEVWEKNREKELLILAGSETEDNAVYPKDVTVKFRDGTVETVSTLREEYMTGSLVYQYPGTVDDSTERLAIVQALADAAWDWRRDGYDVSYCGLVEWHQTGYDDFVTWHFGRQYPREPRKSEPTQPGAPAWGQYAAYTRLAGLPWDVHVSSQEAAGAKSVWYLARTEETIPGGNGSGYCNIYTLSDGSLSLTGDRVRAWGYTTPNYYTIPAGTVVRIEWHDEMQRWFVTGVY